MEIGTWLFLGAILYGLYKNYDTDDFRLRSTNVNIPGEVYHDSPDTIVRTREGDLNVMHKFPSLMRLDSPNEYLCSVSDEVSGNRAVMPIDIGKCRERVSGNGLTGPRTLIVPHDVFDSDTKEIIRQKDSENMSLSNVIRDYEDSGRYVEGHRNILMDRLAHQGEQITRMVKSYPGRTVLKQDMNGKGKKKSSGEMQADEMAMFAEPESYT
jgi:hypothetical protein